MIPAPAAAEGWTPAEIADRDARMAALDADPRTAGGANRPTWLTERVLVEAGFEAKSLHYRNNPPRKKR